MSDLNEILEQRGKEYGDSVGQFQVAQHLKGVMRAGSWRNMNDSQREAIEMICMKLSRLVAGNPNKQDTWDDIAGYAKLGNKEAASEEPPLVAPARLHDD